MLKQKNSSLSMLLDSTNSMMRTASTTFQSLFGAPRRASYCGQPDPTIQLSPNGNTGSLYLIPTAANSNESSLSNTSHDDQRRTVTIYDGRIPSTPTAPSIPFELMTPIDAITQTRDDPVESFVQIVLEGPDDRPPVIRPLSSSRRNSSSRNKHRSNSPNSTSQEKLIETQSMSVTTELFNSLKIHCQTPEVVEPMDFSFLEPVLRGESAAPPTRQQTHSLPNNSRHISPQNSSTSEDSAIDLSSPPCLSNRITIVQDDLVLLESSSDTNHHHSSLISSYCLKVPSSID
jgi:hypothetical protein